MRFPAGAGGTRRRIAVKRSDCGNADLNDLRRHARQSSERGGAKTFVAMPPDDERRVLGFYSLSPASIDHARTLAIVKKGLARYDVSVFRLGASCGRPCVAGPRPRRPTAAGRRAPLRSRRSRSWRGGTSDRRQERSGGRLVRSLWRHCIAGCAAAAVAAAFHHRGCPEEGAAVVGRPSLAAMSPRSDLRRCRVQPTRGGSGCESKRSKPL